MKSLQVDGFDEISNLLRKGHHSEALDRLIGKDGRIRSSYRVDLNHAWYLAGSAAYDAGQVDRALEFFRKSARIWPEDTQALMAVANCYSDLNKPRWAAYYLSKAIQVDSNNPHLRYNLANARFDMAQYKEAADLYREVVKLSTGKTREWAVKNLERALKRVHHKPSAKE
jgi:tetratricopeptide (TPR) repeat protein